MTGWSRLQENIDPHHDLMKAPKSAGFRYGVSF